MHRLITPEFQKHLESLPTKRGKEKAWVATQISPCPLLFRCQVCKEYKLYSSFYPSARKDKRPDVLGNLWGSICKPCYVSAYKQRTPEQNLYFSARKRARERNVEFSISVEDVVIPKYCPVLGIKLQPSVGKGLRPGNEIPCSPTLDRIDSSGGYTPDNVCVISHRANWLKNNATMEELFAIANYVKNETAKRSTKNKELQVNDTTVPEEGV